MRASGEGRDKFTPARALRAGQTETANGKSSALGVEADSRFGLFGWVEQLAQGVEDDLELFAMLTKTAFERIDIACQLLDGKCHLAQADEGIDKLDAHQNGTFAVENIGGHQGTVFGEHPGQKADVAFRCGHIL